MKIETRYSIDGAITPIIGDPQFQKLDEQKLQLLRQRMFQLEQDLLRTEREKGSLLQELEHERRDRWKAQTELQRLLNERGLLRMRALRMWARLGKWVGIPQDPYL